MYMYILGTFFPQNNITLFYALLFREAKLSISGSVGVSAEGVGRGDDGTGSVFMCEGGASVLFYVEICLIVSLGTYIHRHA
jgi:hypothetical protein